MFIKSLMTFNTQSNPIAQITLIFSRYVSPMVLSVPKFVITAMFTFSRSSQPFSHPSMISRITDFFSFPVPNIPKFISLTIKYPRTLSTTQSSMVSQNTKKALTTYFTNKLNLLFTIFGTTFNGAKYTSIWSSFKGFRALFTSFYNHDLSISHVD